MNHRTLLATAAALALVAFGVSANAGVIINEIDYDQPSTDTAEWLELHNPDATAQSLAGLDLVFVNGSNCSTYGTFALDAISIPAGGFVVIGNHACADPSVSIPASNAIQNGAPDGMRIVDRNTGGVLDSVEYEQAGASVCGDTPTDAADSSTDPDGSIQFCGAAGWVYVDASTPCAANNCGPVSIESSSWGHVKSDYR
ncbi:lamin tail domain-containing protein [bacterium]|nr:lamin tail domain-containing protein [bacterium]